MTFKTLYSIVFDGEEGDNNFYAADWNPQKKQWTSSKKEYLSIRWEMDKILSYDAYHSILNHFRLSIKDVSIDKIEKMSPNVLYNLTWQNPKSQTLGDSRLAAEVN